MAVLKPHSDDEGKVIAHGELFVTDGNIYVAIRCIGIVLDDILRFWSYKASACLETVPVGEQKGFVESFVKVFGRGRLVKGPGSAIGAKLTF